jgi:hypothetical protein
MTYKRATGRQEYLKNLNGGKMTYKQACTAKCYDCMNQYTDGKVNCEITGCPLYQFMPYRENGV